MWSTSRTRNGNSLRHPLHRPSCCPNRMCLFWRYGTGVSMSVRLGMSVWAVEPVVEEVAHGLLEPHVDELDGLWRDVDADPNAGLGSRGRRRR